MVWVHRGIGHLVVLDFQTGQRVLCHVEDDEWDALFPMLEKPVVLEGMVQYRRDGRPASIGSLMRISLGPWDSDVERNTDTGDYRDARGVSPPSSKSCSGG